MNTVDLTNYYYKINDIPAFEEIISDKSAFKQKIINKLNVTTSNNQEYKIIFYDKEYLCDDFILIYGILKSLVLNSNNKVVCFSSPKSISFDSFCNTYSEEQENYMDTIVAEEYVEGTMINLFWDKNIGLSGSWEISTRNSVGCNDKLFKNRNSLRSMFLEACIKLNMEIDLLEVRYCYNFILQHPSMNLIISKSDDISLYLIKVYEIVNTEDGTVNIFNVDLQENFKNSVNFTHVKFPKIYYNWNTYEELKDNYASINTPYSIMGFIVYNKNTLVRSKMKNPNYERIKCIKKNDLKSDLKNEYLYLHLKKEGKLEKYLNYYPSFKNDFWLFKKYLHLFTENLFKMYIRCFIKKVQQLNNVQRFLQEHLKYLHKIYITQLKPNKKHVKFSTVVEYVNALNPSVLMYLLYLMKTGDE